MERERQRGRFGVMARLAVGMATFGSATPISKIITTAIPVFVASAARVAIGALVLIPFALGRGARLRDLSRRDWLITALIALFGMVGFTALMLYGMGMVSGVIGAIVMSTTPAVVAAGSMIFAGDRATWRKLTAIALAVGGVVILHIGSRGPSAGDHPILGSLLVAAAVCCEAGYTLLGKRVSERVDPVAVAALAALLAVPILVPLAIWQWESLSIEAIELRVWIALAWYGAGTLALGTWLWYSGIARTEGVIAAGFMGVMPVSALVLSYILLAEPFEWIHLVGFTIVGGSVALMATEHARVARQSE